MPDQYFEKAMRDILEIVDDEVTSPPADILAIFKARHPRVSEDDLKILILEARSQR